MFWRKKQSYTLARLDENIGALAEGDLCRIPWIFCVFAEDCPSSKLAAARALSETLQTLGFDDIVRIDSQMRQTTSMEWYIDWRGSASGAS